MVVMTNSGDNTWWIDAYAGESRWKLILLLHTEPVTATAVHEHGEPEILHLVWHDLRWRPVARQVWVVRIATTRTPILLMHIDDPDAQHWSGSHWSRVEE
jgi:hypothetical protein